MKKKEIEATLIELCKYVEHLANNCANHLEKEHKTTYQTFPYFHNIEMQMREFRQNLERAAKP